VLLFRQQKVFGRLNSSAVLNNKLSLAVYYKINSNTRNFAFVLRVVLRPKSSTRRTTDGLKAWYLPLKLLDGVPLL